MVYNVGHTINEETDIKNIEDIIIDAPYIPIHSI